jgi:hypothetical protein
MESFFGTCDREEDILEALPCLQGNEKYRNKMAYLEGITIEEARARQQHIREHSQLPLHCKKKQLLVPNSQCISSVCLV